MCDGAGAPSNVCGRLADGTANNIGRLAFEVEQRLPLATRPYV